MAWTNDPIQSLGQAFELAQKALALDNKDNRSHWVQGAVYLYQRQFERAATAYQRALSLNPNDADVIAQYAMFLLYTARFEEADDAIRKALRLNPHCPWWYFWLLGWTEFWLQRYDESIAAIEQIGIPIPECRLVTIASLMSSDRVDEACREAAEVLKLVPTFTIQTWAVTQPFEVQANLDRITRNLNEAGLPR